MSDTQTAPGGLALRSIQQLLLYDALDRSPALVFVADDEMRYLAVNNTACTVLGYTREELLSLRVTDIVVSVEAPALYQRMMDEKSQQGDVELLTKDGAQLTFIYEAAEVEVAGTQYWISIGFVNSQLQEKVEQLESALLSRVAIEQATGVLIGRYGLDPTAAFDALRGASRASNVRLHDLARRVVDEPDTPEEVSRRLREGTRPRRSRRRRLGQESP
jgi:PAS domain S-box-containing protein